MRQELSPGFPGDTMHHTSHYNLHNNNYSSCIIILVVVVLDHRECILIARPNATPSDSPLLRQGAPYSREGGYRGGYPT